MENLSEIQKCLIENISNKDVIFVFSTDVVKNSWIDWLVMNPEFSKTNTVPLEKFIAWDNFKSEFIKSSQQGKSSVPSLMRKFFVRDLICKNSENPFLKKIINPEFSQKATSFTDWICKILPSLNLWYEKYTQFIENPTPEAEIQKNDEENQDYLEIYKRYYDFLDKNNMFEPSWIQPDFSGDNNKIFIIFYPEILEDYADYVEIFKNTKNIKQINLPEEDKNGNDSPKCYKYSDARQEIRRTILQIRKLVHPDEFDDENTSEKTTRWDEISLSVPNLEVYRPYLEREFKKYNIPFVIRAGLPLTTNCAGQIFNEIYECYQSNFSYDSVRALLQDEFIPWLQKTATDDEIIATDFSLLKENLIREGNIMRCICGYEEKNGSFVDIWEEAFRKIGNDNAEFALYTKLKKNITSLCQANSFEAIETAWTIFKKEFIDENAFSKSANDILGHCITKLKEMIQIENEYVEQNDFKLGNHFEFFLNELKSKTYTPQNKTVGLNVYPYKLTATAHFKYQFVINASQANLEIPFKRLSFLTTEKRTIFGLLDEDKKFNASHCFIRLYDQNSEKNIVRFSFCEDSFDGFAIAHTFLNLLADKNPLQNLDKYDFYLNEKKLILDSGKADFNPEKNAEITLTKAQKENFLKWMAINKTSEEPYNVSNLVKNKIQEKLVSSRQKEDRKNLVFTQTDVRQFFPCPRYWLLSSVLKLEDDSLDADLMKPFDMGNLYHEILENFMIQFKNKALPIANNNVFENEEEISLLITEISKKVINKRKEFSNSPLVLTMLLSQIENITKTIMDFLHNFCIQRSEKVEIKKTTKTEGFGGYIVKAVESERNLPGEKYDLFGKIDLILTSPLNNEDIGWTIIDYKNSAVKATSQIFVQEDHSLGDFQMPMYISLQTNSHPEKRNFEASLESIDYAGFEGITSLDKNSAIDNDKLGRKSEDFSNTMDEFSTYLDDFREKIEKNELEPKTIRKNQSAENGVKNHFDIDVMDNCAKCQFSPICRYNYNVGKRNIKYEQ